MVGWDIYLKLKELHTVGEVMQCSGVAPIQVAEYDVAHGSEHE